MPGEDFPQYNPEGLNPEGSFPADPVDPQQPYSPGNRPASGARRATPGEVLTRGFQGSQAAGDFLGLDLEFTANQANDPMGGGLGLEPAPTTIGENEPYPSSAPSEDAFAPQADSGFGGGPSSYEFGEDLGKDEFALDSTPKKNPARTLLVTLAVGGVVAAGVLYGPGLYSRFAPKKEPPREVARVPREAPVPPADPATDTVVQTPGPALVDTAPTPTDFEDPLVSATSDPADQSLDPIPTPFSFDSESDGGLDPQASAGSDETEPATDIVASLLAGAAGPTPSAGASTFPNLAGSDFEWASEDMLELIWRGEEVPMEAVFAPARTIMPRVGPVRIFTNSGDIFEGRLYAVGQERVWIDAAPGRIGLDGNRIERIERLPFEPGSPNQTDLSETGKRVRVRVPGGLLFGRVLKTEGDEVILALDDGGRVRVQSDSVEDMGSGRAIIVHR